MARRRCYLPPLAAKRRVTVPFLRELLRDPV